MNIFQEIAIYQHQEYMGQLFQVDRYQKIDCVSKSNRNSILKTLIKDMGGNWIL